MNKKDLELKFEKFDLEMETALQSLLVFVSSLENKKLLPLDYSWESLDKLETLYKLVLKGKIMINTDLDIFSLRIARYLGETLRKNLGGNWNIEKDIDLINYGLPGIENIKGLAPDYNWCPIIVVENFKYDLKKGLFKESGESHLDWIK